MAHALENGRLIHVDAARQGGDYECPDCGGRMCPVQGVIKAWHWRHISEGGWCGYSGYGSETVAHLAAKDALERDRWLRVPPGRVKAGTREYSVAGVPGGVVRFAKVLVEQSRGSIKPDLIGVLPDGRELFIEVCVSHRVGSEKLAEIERLGVPCVEITMDENMDPHGARIEWIWHSAIAAEQERRTAEYDAWVRAQREAADLERARGEAEVEDYFRSLTDEKLLSAAVSPYKAMEATGIGYTVSRLAAEAEIARRGGKDSVSAALKCAADDRRAKEKLRQAEAEAAREREARDRALIAEAVRGLSDEDLAGVSPMSWPANAPTGVSHAARWGYVETAVSAERKRRKQEATEAATREMDRVAALARQKAREEAEEIKRVEAGAARREKERWLAKLNEELQASNARYLARYAAERASAGAG